MQLRCQFGYFVTKFSNIMLLTLQLTFGILKPLLFNFFCFLLINNDYVKKLKTHSLKIYFRPVWVCYSKQRSPQAFLNILCFFFMNLVRKTENVISYPKKIQCWQQCSSASFWHLFCFIIYAPLTPITRKESLALKV